MTNTNNTAVADSSPEFLAAVDDCLRITEALGQDHPHAKRAMQRVMALAPRSLMDELHKMADELGLMPEPDGYLEDGQPVVSLQAVAAQLGISLEEAQKGMDEMLAELEAAGVPVQTIDPASVHRKQ
ncbi:MAG: hypothetical protein PHU77_06640 [Simplicispira sp.]|nr:hypothetical protein [Simplicispira sp.]